MAGTRTAPTVDGSPNSKKLSIRFIDRSGDLRTTSNYVSASITDAEVEAIVAQTQLLSRGSIFEVILADVYLGAKQASNAEQTSYQSVYDNVVLLQKASATEDQNVFIPAPIQATLIPNGDVVDTSAPGYTTWRDLWTSALGGTYAPISVRFTERREKNDSTPA